MGNSPKIPTKLLVQWRQMVWFAFFSPQGPDLGSALALVSPDYLGVPHPSPKNKPHKTIC